MNTTISLSDEDWDAVVKALLDQAQTQAELGFEPTATALLELTGRVVETLEFAREAAQ